MDHERISMLALHFVPGVGDFLLKQLISYCGSAEQVFKQSKGKLIKIPGIGDVTAEAIHTGKTFEKAEKELRKAEREEVTILFFIDKAYPARLKSIDDAPAVLYTKGNVNLNHAKTIAIVGTRQATDYGKDQVEKIIADLQLHEVLVISGLAYGIDIHVHKQALKHGLQTVGVLGSGLDVIYPAAHKETAKKMINQGGLMTENSFGTQPDAHNFPARNRIIAGLCDGLIVVEAAEKGGALITAEIANSYNKDVFAVPGNIGQTYSEGCNKLIKTNKANLFMSVKDLEYIMGWTSEATTDEKQLTLDLPQFGPEEQKVIKVLQEKKSAMMIDDLSHILAMPQGTLASILLSLEFSNAVVSLPGKMYRLK